MRIFNVNDCMITEASFIGISLQHNCNKDAYIIYLRFIGDRTKKEVLKNGNASPRLLFEMLNSCVRPKKIKIVKTSLSSELETRNNHRPVFRRRAKSRVSLDYKINCQAQLGQALVPAMHARCISRAGNGFGIVCDERNVVSSAHQFL
jgi:hypothetical protein